MKHAPLLVRWFLTLADLKRRWATRSAGSGSATGTPVHARSTRGTKNYHWQDCIRPHAASGRTGDQRINPFGIGGEIEIRSGLLVQKQPITEPAASFRIWASSTAPMSRASSGRTASVRAEFALKADQEIVTEQRLKGVMPLPLRMQWQAAWSL